MSCMASLLNPEIFAGIRYVRGVYIFAHAHNVWHMRILAYAYTSNMHPRSRPRPHGWPSTWCYADSPFNLHLVIGYCKSQVTVKVNRVVLAEVMAPARRTHSRRQARRRLARSRKRKTTAFFLAFLIYFPVPRPLSRFLERTVRTEPQTVL